MTALLAMLFVLGLGDPFALLPQAIAADATQMLKSGRYEGLMLAVDHDGNLSGYYREVQGTDVSKTCSFFLKGKVADNQATILAWNDQMLPGLLKTDGAGVKLQIEKAREFPGCALVLMPEIAQGVSFDKTMEAKWNALEIVAGDRAYLYSEPSNEKKLTAYVIGGDVVGTLLIKGEWIQIEFPRAGEKSIRGWLHASDIKPLLPPQ